MTQRQKDLLIHFATLNERCAEIAVQMAETAKTIERERALVDAILALQHDEFYGRIQAANRKARSAFGAAGEALEASKKRAVAEAIGLLARGAPAGEA
jgi:hypothetical protein